MRTELALVALVWCGAVLAAPSLRQRRDLTAIPAGIPVDLLFETCGDQLDSPNDIGPCIQQLLSGTIELAKPAFFTGVDIKGKKKVLDPLDLKDVPEKAGRKFRFSLKNLQVHGLSTVSVDDVRLEPTRLALQLSFEHLTATSDMTVRYSFIRGDSEAELKLLQPSIRVEAGWTLAADGDQLNIQLVNPKVDISIDQIQTRLTQLGGLGGFLQSILNNNSDVLLKFLVPELERQAEEKLVKEFSTIKLAKARSG